MKQFQKTGFLPLDWRWIEDRGWAFNGIMCLLQAFPIFLAIFLLSAILTFQACSPQKATTDAARGLWDVIGPEYTAYVQGDVKLGADSKETRIRSAKLMSELLKEPEAKK